MPYIAPERRRELAARVSGPGARPRNVGELTYVLSDTIQRYLESNYGDQVVTYAMLAEPLAALEATKMEYYHHVLRKHEDHKMAQNGEVFYYDPTANPG